jgi:hypothetical protein
MKNIIIIASISIIVIIIFLTSIIMAVNKTEEQKYTLILKENDFDKNVHSLIKKNLKLIASIKLLANPLWNKEHE